MKNFIYLLFLLFIFTHCGSDSNNSSSTDADTTISFDFTELETRITNIQTSQPIDESSTTISQLDLSLDEIEADLQQIINMGIAINQTLLNDAFSTVPDLESRASLEFEKAENITGGEGLCVSGIDYQGTQDLNDNNISNYDVTLETSCTDIFSDENFEFSLIGFINQDISYQSELTNTFIGTQYLQDLQNTLKLDLQVYGDYSANVVIDRIQESSGNVNSATTTTTITAIIHSGERFDCRAHLTSIGQNVELNCLKFFPD